MGRTHFWPDLLLVGSEQERKALTALGACADRVWGGVDLAKFRPAASGERRLLRRRWQLPDDQRIVLHVGHLTTGRNLEYLVPLARSERVRVAVAVGTSQQRKPEAEHLLQALRHAGVTVFDGFLPAIEELFRLADCYVFTPSSDNAAIEMPLSVVEALASGLPVASMRFGALAEHFIETPAVRLCDSPDELRRAVMEQLNSRPDTSGLADGFSWERIAERMTQMLASLLPSEAGQRPPRKFVD